ncbi:MAG: hypothetical protein AAB602_03635 [Patescibacteria group bacterium]
MTGNVPQKSHQSIINSRIQGQFSLEVLIFSTVVVILISGFIFLSLSFTQFSVRGLNKQLAFSIAEAGVEYYRWHLAHAPNDFQDGTGQPGPYTHNYYNKSGQIIGQFILDITPPPVGSTVVTVQSTGRVITDSSIQKIIKVKFGNPSLVRYAIVSNDAILFNTSTFVYGQTHSNGGVHFDGIAYNVVYSAQPQYDDLEHGGGNEFGVHTHVSPIDPLPPASVPSRPDVFTVGRQFPVPAIDFSSISSNLSQIKNSAQSGGLYFGSSSALGYHAVLKTNDTLDLYRVTSLTPKPPGCNNTKNQDGWGTWSIKNETLIGNYSFPANGFLFTEDDLWISGQIQTARLTIGSGQFPENSQTDRNIIINSSTLYTYYDGQDVLGLIAQKNINFGLVSEDNLRIDAAMVTKNGRIGRYYYRPPTSQGQGGQNCQQYNIRSVITTYGILASNRQFQFAYEDGTGFQTKNLIYDANLLYGPPPGFPSTGSQYVQVSWTEMQ